MRRASAAMGLLSGLGLVVGTASLAVAGPLDGVTDPVAKTVEEPVETVIKTVEQPVETVVKTVEQPVETVVKTVEQPVETVVEAAPQPVTAPKLSGTAVQSPTAALSTGAPAAQEPATAQAAPPHGQPPAGSPAASAQQPTGSSTALRKPDGGVVETELFRARGVALLQDRADPEAIDLCILIPGSGSEPPRVEPLGEYPVDQLAAAGLVIKDPLVECETVVGGVKEGPQVPLSLTDALAKTGTAAVTLIAAGTLMVGVGTRLRLAGRRFRVLY